MASTAFDSLQNGQVFDGAGGASLMKTRLTQQFASMDAKVAAYKSTMTFLENQVDAWNKQY